MSGGREGTLWPDPAQGTPFTWGVRSDAQTVLDAQTPPVLRTPPEVRYATWRRRGSGFLMDFFLMLFVPNAFFWTFAFSLPETSNPDPPMSVVSTVLLWCLLVSFTSFVLYPVWFIGRRGQTPGMKQKEIRLFRVNREGSLEAPGWNCAWGRACLAAGCWLFCVAWILDYLWPLRDSRHQCLHDKVVRTVVVDERDEQTR
jgi:uncharacterized RDD family membrane protein YckC